ncbi:MAG TPA: hypothetical protein PLP33_24535 [Leptospiraceae bacterium]|nr:hypothetical protein [Leptospiraceae bacterium]
MNDYITISVRTGKGTVSGETFTDIVEKVERAPIDMAGWQKIRYKNRYYALRGGIRTEHFICLDNPIKPRIVGKQAIILNELKKTDLWLSASALHKAVELNYPYVTLFRETASTIKSMWKRGILAEKTTIDGHYYQVAGKI